MDAAPESLHRTRADRIEYVSGILHPFGRLCGIQKMTMDAWAARLFRAEDPS